MTAAVADQVADEALVSLLATPAGRADPYPLYRTIRERAPLLRSGFGPLVVSRYSDCVAVLRDPRMGRGLVGRTRSNEARRGMWSRTCDPELRQRYFDRSADNMLFADPPDHSRLRKLVSRAFTPRRVACLRPAIDATVERLLDGVEAAGEADIMSALAFPLPVSVIGELLGVPEADRAGFQDLVRAGAAGIEPLVDDATILAAFDAQDRMRDYFSALVAERRRRPRDDLLSGLVAAREHGDALSDSEVISTAILLFAAGFETTTNLIGNGLLALLTHPEQFRRLCEEPSLAPSAVEELLRWDSPVQVNFRTALEASEVAGENVDEGKGVLVLQGAANRDPERFADPDTLDLGRADNVPLSFGWGAHHCIGAPLARSEGEAVFSAIASRFPSMRLAGEPPQWRARLTLRGLVSLRVSVA